MAKWSMCFFQMGQPLSNSGPPTPCSNAGLLIFQQSLISMFPVKYWQLFQEMVKYSVNKTKRTCTLDLTYQYSLQPLKYKFDYVISLLNIITTFLCNFGTNANLFKMTPKAFHESAHCYFSHCISYLMPFKHIPHARVKCLLFLECASKVSVYFSVWPGCLHWTHLSLRIQLGHSWAGILPPEIGLCSILDQNTPLPQYCANIWAFNTDGEQHGCLELHLIGLISASGYLECRDIKKATALNIYNCSMNDSNEHHQVHKNFFDPLQQEVSVPWNKLNSLSLTLSYFRIPEGIRDNHFTKLAPHKQEFY